MSKLWNGTTSTASKTSAWTVAIGDYTFGCWIYPLSVGEGNFGRIIQMEESGNGRAIFQVENSTTPTFTAQQDFTTTNADFTAPNDNIFLNKWQCIFAVFHASTKTFSLYWGDQQYQVIEVESYTTSVAGSGTIQTATDVYLGNRSAGDRTFDGQISRFFAVDDALTTTQMNAYRMGDVWSLFEGNNLQAYYPLDSPTDLRVEDWGPNAAHLTATNLTTQPDTTWDSSNVVPVLFLAGTDATAIPSAISVSVSVPSVSAKAESTVTPNAVSVPFTIPATTATAGSNAQPSAISVPIAIPQAIATSEGAGTATPLAITVPVTIPAVNAFAVQHATATPDAISVSVSLPAPMLGTSSTVAVSVLSIAVAFPSVTVQGNIVGIATPNPISVSVTIPILTGTEIKNFIPPARDEVPNLEYNTKGLARRLFRHYILDSRADNVYFIDGVVTNDPPFTTYGLDGQPDEEAWSRVDAVWYGGHGPHRVTTAQAAALTGAGYALGQDVDVR